jgi:pilus assembly protein Flp/PilA
VFVAWFVVFHFTLPCFSFLEILMMRKLIRNRKGQGLVEYALIIAGVALICAVGVSIFGHKVAGLIDTVAVILPGAHTECNGPITDGQLIETTSGASGAIQLDTATIVDNAGKARLDQNLGFVDGTGELLTPDAG